jgi:CDP-4-dehydro-6-deoxyglucose reductase
LLLIGGGTGYAPLKAMIRQVLEMEASREVTLFWGARTKTDLYEDDWLRDLAAKHARFRYTAALSEEEVGGQHKSGLVHEVVTRCVAGLAGFDIYAAGPPAMIDAVRAALPPRGADPERIYIDSFDYAHS